MLLFRDVKRLQVTLEVGRPVVILAFREHRLLMIFTLVTYDHGPGSSWPVNTNESCVNVTP